MQVTGYAEGGTRTSLVVVALDWRESILLRRRPRAVVRRIGVQCTGRVGRVRIGIARFALYSGCS